MNGYSIVLVPRDWVIDSWHKDHKSIYAFGPLRFVLHRGLGPWKDEDDGS